MEARRATRFRINVVFGKPCQIISAEDAKNLKYQKKNILWIYLYQKHCHCRPLGTNLATSHLRCHIVLDSGCFVQQFLMLGKNFSTCSSRATPTYILKAYSAFQSQQNVNGSETKNILNQRFRVFL